MQTQVKKGKAAFAHSSFSSWFLRHLAASCSGFLAVGLLIGAKSTALIPLMIMQLGFATYSLALLCVIQFILFKIHDLNISLRILRRAVEDLQNIGQQQKIDLTRQIEDLEPISGYGLFTVDRTTLTSTFSVSITYLIVLIQFKQTSLNT